MAEPPLALWSVTVTVAGQAVDVAELRPALDRLVGERPFLSSIRYSDTRVEVRYWDEARDVDDAAAMAVRLWPEHRTSAGLPAWDVVGVEVVDRATVEHRAAQRQRGVLRPQRRARAARAGLDLLGDVAPW
ncbi:hypothetical protein [Kineococcus indalonis]|uniref:hypothetical protein n=1 Tax=Kineococcus indalonis TaxID=2696566 RepID=UPI0014135B39|nr:hypothetical protein [Kineococcus indalonis]NAZ87501.1 hypothetical protein [Kineococcus indalonis]